jgi:hypothetical protein
MKLSILTTLAILGLASSSFAASFITAGIDRGLVLSDGTTALSSGIIRFGTFAAVNFATATQSELEAAFTEVLTTTGPFTYGGNPGLFEFTGDENPALTYAGGSTVYEGVTYDLTGGIDLTNASDIAGSTVYAWVMNSTTPGSATQQAILSESAIWQDAQNFDPSTFFDTFNATRHIGTLSSTTLAGTSVPAVALSNIAAVPEPSRALLGMVGLGALVFRRRRRA